MEYYLVDVFAEQKYGGNQLAVFICQEFPDDAEMLATARETDLAETVFLKLAGTHGNPEVRIFTVAYELPFAGHPTVGAAWVAQHLKPDNRFDKITTQAGQVPVMLPKKPQNEPVIIELPQPAFKSRYKGSDITVLTDLRADDFSQNMLPQVVSAGISYLLVPLRSVDALARVQVMYAQWIDFLRREHLHATTSDSGRTTSLYFFAPYNDRSKKQDGQGIAQPGRLAARMFCEEHMMPREDAATGSAAGCLLAYLLHLGADSRLTFTIDQGQAVGRPSKLYAYGKKHEKTYSLQIGGRVQLVAKGIWQ